MSDRKRVWIVSELYYPEDTSTGYILTRIAEGLARHLTVRVLCARPGYAARGTRAPSREKRSGVLIERCPSTTFPKDVLPLRLINAATVTLTLFARALWRVRRGECVLVVTNPPLLPFLVSAACRIRRARCFLLVQDVYPEALVAAGLVRPGGLPARSMDWLSRRLVRGVEKISVLGRDMAALVSRKLDGDASRVALIPNWADLDQVTPAPRAANALLRELGLCHKFVVQYSGNMGRTHGLETLAASAALLKNVPDIHFLFIGSGAKRGWLEAAVEREGLRNVTLLPPRPRAELPVSLNACDIAIISFVSGMAGVSVPCRLYNIMAAGKPVVAAADSQSELALVVREEDIGWVAPPDQPERIAEAILEARAHPETLAAMGLRARAAAERKYTLDAVIDSYLCLIRGAHDAQE